MSQQHSWRPCLGSPAWDAAGLYQTGVEGVCWMNAVGLISAGHKGLIPQLFYVREGLGFSEAGWLPSATCLQGWGHAQRGSGGEEALVRAAWRSREMHLLGQRGWARAERGRCRVAGGRAGRLGLGAAGAGSGSAAARAFAAGPTALTDPWHRGGGGRRSALSRGPLLLLPAPLQPS